LGTRVKVRTGDCAAANAARAPRSSAFANMAVVSR
jgi:hypothetical protein